MLLQLGLSNYSTEQMARYFDICDTRGFVQPYAMSLSEVCLRWLVHHSALGSGDAVILGAKRMNQLEKNVVDCRKRHCHRRW